MRYLLCVVLALGAAVLSAQSNDELRRGFDELAKAHPTHLKIEDLPNAGFVATLRDLGVDGTLPAVLLLGSLDGREQTPGAGCLQITRELLEDKALRDQFGKVELTIIPMPNPQGREASLHGTLLPFDDDRDGETDEDGPSDLNGDGKITQMRVRRKGGAYVASAIDPRILIKAEPGQTGEWDLYTEGQDDDGDGRVNEDARGTVTLANDWAIRWSKEQPGANRFMMQLKETRALADFILARPNLTAAFQLKSLGNDPLFAQGPKAAKEDPYTRDKEITKALVKVWGKPAKSTGAATGDGAGNIIDWLYESQGLIAANLYLGAPPAKEPEKKEEKKEEEEGKAEIPEEPATPKPTKEEAAQLAWLEHAPGDYIAWTQFNHPQFGEVEIGGWVVDSRLEPNAEDAEAGASKTAEFLRQILKTLPQTEVAKVEAEDKGDGLYRIRLTLHNAGGFDYRTAFAEKNRIGLPIFVSVNDTKRVEMVSGTRRQKQENITANGTATFEWFVRVGDSGDQLDFQIESERTGNFKHSIAVKDCDKLTTVEDDE